MTIWRTGTCCRGLVGRFVFFLFSLLLTWSQADAEMVYQYVNPFTENLVAGQSFHHSPIWLSQASPPNEPYLTYILHSGSRALLMMGFLEEESEVIFALPVEPHRSLFADYGTISFDLDFLSSESYIPVSDQHFSYRLSANGRFWSDPIFLKSGHHVVPLDKVNRTAFIGFNGSKAILDNLHIEFHINPPDIRVPNDFKTIQQAINAALPGEIIEVAPGTYSGPGNWDIELEGKPITLRGRIDVVRAVIDCDDVMPHRGFYVHQGESHNTVIQNFVIKNGSVSANVLPESLGAWVGDPAHPIGGGIFCEFASPSIQNCIITQSHARQGGGIGCVGSSARISNCEIIGNSVCGHTGGPGFGGGLSAIEGGSVLVQNSVISGNIGCDNSLGGGVFADGGNLTIEGGRVDQNAVLNEGLGGGVYASGTETVLLSNVVISYNRAFNGAGINAEGLNQMLVSHCTIAGNSLTATVNPPDFSGGLRFIGNNLDFHNCIVWFNDGNQLFTDAFNLPSVRHSNIQGGFAGSGNSNVDPLFAQNKPAANGDFHLRSLYGRFDPSSGIWVSDPNDTSPAIDASDPQSEFLLEPLSNGDRANVGAYGNTRQASKSRGRRIFHVDGNSGNDRDTGSDRSRALATIQQGINLAMEGDCVLVWPGVYIENVIFLDRNIVVRSASQPAVLQGDSNDGIAVTFQSNQQPSTVLSNMIIRNSVVTAILCANSACPTLLNLTIVNNGFGLQAFDQSTPQVKNCIFWNNSGGDLFFAAIPVLTPEVSFSCLQKEFVDGTGTGNIIGDPMFVDLSGGDYHLKSQFGRFQFGDPDIYTGNTDRLVQDAETSPCIDAGCPFGVPRAERLPNGGVINMGAYGGTPFAAHSPWMLSGDLNRDGRVNYKDFPLVNAPSQVLLIANDWLTKLPW